MADQAAMPAATSEPVVRERDGSVWLAFANGTVQSRMLAADPAALVLEYTRLMMGFLLFQPAPARIAMIGLGGGSLAKYCRMKLPGADFTAVEISPAVIALRDAFDIPPDGPRFRVLRADGAAFVRRAGEPLDALLVDGFDRNGQPAPLCSPAFYDACRDRLGAGGVLVVNLHSDEPTCGASVERIAQSFDERIAVVEADHSDNLVVFAGAGAPFPPPFADLVRCLRALETTHPVDLGATMGKVVEYGEPRHALRRRRWRGR